MFQSMYPHNRIIVCDDFEPFHEFIFADSSLRVNQLELHQCLIDL